MVGEARESTGALTQHHGTRRFQAPWRLVRRPTPLPARSHKTHLGSIGSEEIDSALVPLTSPLSAH
jgi:hypothetical protein